MDEREYDLIKRSARAGTIRVTIEGHQGAGKTIFKKWLQAQFPGLRVKEIQTQPLPKVKK